MKHSPEERLLLDSAKMLRRGQKACERQGWEKGESTEAWYHAAGTLASQIEIHYGLHQGQFPPIAPLLTCELCGTIANVEMLRNGARICAECRNALREAV